MSTLNFCVNFCSNKYDIFKNIEEFSQILIENKVIGFKNITASDEDLQEIMVKLYRGPNYHNEKITGMLYGQNHLGDNKTETTDTEEFIYGHWHMDNPYFENVPSYTGMHMVRFSCSPEVGQTYFIKLSNLYNNCPEKYLPLLSNIKLLSATGFSQEKINELHAHPAIVLHPVTEEKMIYWTGHDMRVIEDCNWFNDFKIWTSEFISDPKNRITWKWNEGDILIWDNRAVVHSFSPGWKHNERIFNRCELQYEKPYIE